MNLLGIMDYLKGYYDNNVTYWYGLSELFYLQMALKKQTTPHGSTLRSGVHRLATSRPRDFGERSELFYEVFIRQGNFEQRHWQCETQ